MKKSITRAIAMMLMLISCLTQASCTQSSTQNSGQTTTDPANDQKPSPGQTEYASYIEKAEKQAAVLYQISEPSNFSDKLTLATLQGLVANLSDEQILVQGGAYSYYTKYLKSNWGCEVKTRINGKGVDLKTLISHYKDLISGYILTSSDSSKDDGNVAISLAGLLNAVVVTPENSSACEDAGLSCIFDATGKNDKWLRSSEYWDSLNKKIAFEQPLNMAPKLVDYAVMCKAYFSFYNGHNRTEHQNKYSFLGKNGIVLGYNNTLGEYDTVYSLSGADLQMIPSDHAYNLSTLSGFRLAEEKQKTGQTSGVTDKKVHTVCLIMSDGDNLQWLTNNFATSENWFASKKRGSFSMGWGLPAATIDLAAPMNAYLYDSMTAEDEFIMQLSGLGYTFPSLWSSSGRDEMAEKLAEYMRRSDLRYAEILDDNGMNTRTLSSFTKQDGIDGLFYIDYSNYAGKNGQIVWSNDKPAVAARYRLWAGTSDGSIDAISKAVNKASTDPASADAYSFIILHAWSGLSGGKLTANGNTMDAAAKLVSSFDDDVEVVTPSEFMDRIIANHAK